MSSASRYGMGGSSATRFTGKPQPGGADTTPIDSLSRSLTINSVSRQADLWLQGGDATTDEWVAERGNSLPIAGSGSDPGVGDVVSNGDPAVLFGSSLKHYEAATTDNWSFGTDDFVVEALLQLGATSGGEIVAGKFQSSSSYIELQSSNVLLRFNLNFGLGSISISGPSPGATGTLAHFMVFVDRSGFGLAYCNNSAGATDDVTAYTATSLNTTDKMNIGSRAGTAPYLYRLAHLATWQGAGWLDTHAQAAVVAARYAALGL